ncbi:hypothetical protein EMEDMD4_220005 [Sinorhizobium medicae]|uniref:Uncharacterized protein n=1 Tax=Sinorhizobium medicae TaxID=110321 RepID=A0A508WTM7_9HYPH|nr:hypothetical protein EMEDMD4_220005 [Sinorhizobium medicae]
MRRTRDAMSAARGGARIFAQADHGTRSLFSNTFFKCGGKKPWGIGFCGAFFYRVRQDLNFKRYARDSYIRQGCRYYRGNERDRSRDDQAGKPHD